MKKVKKHNLKPLWLYTHGYFKNRKGITLIALIVTIIILLILAGISISMLAGNNGILNKAPEAAKEAETAGVKEQIQLAVLDAITEGLGKIETTESLDNSLQNHVEKEYNLDGDVANGWTITVPENKISYHVDSSGELTEVEYEEPIDNSESLVLGFADELGTRATIYLYGNSDKITSGNLTIKYPNNITRTITAVSDNTEISDSANYVTYTVRKNGIYTFNITDGVNTTETKVKVGNIETFTPIEEVATKELSNNAYSYKGAAVPKGYYVDTKSEVNTGLVITDEIDSEGYSTGNEWVWVPVNNTFENNDYYIEESGTFAGADTVTYSKYSKLYSFSQARARDPYGTFYPFGTTTGILGKPSTKGSAYREPALLTSTTEGESAYYSSINKRGTTEKFDNITDIAIQYRDDYEKMTSNVDKYGGFYIGRYELTLGGEKPGYSPVRNEDWYSLYNRCMTFDNEYVTSGMIYGTLWDATMQWLVKSNYPVGYTGSGASGYGNYTYETVTVKDNNTTIILKQSGKAVLFTAGKTSYTKMNNIYDLSGNHIDWTQETNGINIRIGRGGYAGNTNTDYTFAAFRASYCSTNILQYVSSRPYFHIK